MIQRERTVSDYNLCDTRDCEGSARVSHEHMGGGVTVWYYLHPLSAAGTGMAAGCNQPALRLAFRFTWGKVLW